jgi:hypothetical protein
VNNINVTNVHNFYNRRVVNSTAGSRVSHSGGVGGTTARPTRAELAVAHGHRSPPTATQTRLQQTASPSRAQAARMNPPVSRNRAPMAATSRIGAASRTANHPGNAGRVSPLSAGTPHVAPQPVHGNSRSAPTQRRRAGAPQPHVHSTLRSTTNVRNTPKARYSPRGIDRSSSHQAHSIASSSPAPHSASHQALVPAQNQSRNAPSSHGAPPRPHGGEKRKG